MAESEVKPNDNARKAGAIVTMLDKPLLARVLKHLSGPELTTLMRTYDHLSSGQALSDGELSEAGNWLLGSAPSSAENHFRDALEIAIGGQGAAQLRRHDSWRKMADRVKPATFAAAIRSERPQTVALALSQLPPKFAADVLAILPPELRTGAIECIQSATPSSENALDAILGAIEEAIAGSSKASAADPKRAAQRVAEMLNQLDSAMVAEILESIRGRDPARAAEIESQMFQFSDFLRLDNRMLQQILAAMRPERIAVALKGTTEGDRDTILGALPDQVRAVVQAEMSDSGRVPKSEVEAARREITELCQRLDREGKIRLRPDSADMVS
jgi:flagellar motor switch protein FliG